MFIATAAVSPETLSASRAFVRRWIISTACFWLALIPHSDSPDKPAKIRTIAPNTRAILLPILIFDMDVISFLYWNLDSA